MKAWLVYRLLALRCALRIPAGRTLTWWARNGQMWVATECEHCGALRNSKPVLGLKVTPERVSLERRRMLFWHGGGL